MHAPLSVIVITRNEERNIDACLAGVAWAREIIVVDAESSDRTVGIARAHTPHVLIEPWRGFAEAKTSALSRATQEWVLWLDADERVLPETAEEIRRIVAASADAAPHAAYRVARRAYFLGRWIRHCGWYPGHVTRLFRRGAARFTDAAVHEQLVVDGSIGVLAHDIEHHTDETLEHYFEKYNRYTTLAADELARRGRRVGVIGLLVRPWWMFVKMYLIQRGFLDGLHGFILCRLSASYVFTKYAKLWQRAGHDAH